MLPSVPPIRRCFRIRSTHRRRQGEASREFAAIDDISAQLLKLFPKLGDNRFSTRLSPPQKKYPVAGDGFCPSCELKTYTLATCSAWSSGQLSRPPMARRQQLFFPELSGHGNI
jgi:hypothetical protein